MKYAICKDILWKIVDDEVVIVNMKKEKYSYLNATGTEVWKLINDGIIINDMCAILSAKYDSPGDTMRKDIQAIIKELLKTGLIKEIA